MDGSKSQGQKECEEEEDKEESEVRCVALKAKLESVQRCTRRVKDMVGIEEAQEVLPKLEQQMGNMQHLLKARAENQGRLKPVSKTNETLSKWKWRRGNTCLTATRSVGREWTEWDLCG